jgi:hypothetical protein
MIEDRSAYPPDDPGAPRRGLFSRRSDEAQPRPGLTPSEYRLADTLQQAVDERLEQGLRSIEEQATDLMREIAAEMWRASGADVRPEQERIVSLLSRDGAVRSMLTQNEERFQALQLRSANIESAMAGIAEHTRATRSVIDESVRAVREVAGSPAVQGVETVRTQLEQVEHHIAAAFAHLDERDRALTEAIEARIEEQRQLVEQEATRISQAMQGYVQGGVETVGHLAQRIEQHAETFAETDVRVGEQIRDALTERTDAIEQQLDMLTERVGLHGRDQQAVQAAVERLIEARVMGLAQLIRADSQALRGLIEERVTDQQATIQEAIEAGLAGRMTEVVDQVRDRVEDLQRTTSEQIAALTTALQASVDKNFFHLADQIDVKLGRVEEAVAQRAAEAADVAIASSFGQTTERLTTAIGAVEGLDAMIAEGQVAAEERLLAAIDERLSSEERMNAELDIALMREMEAKLSSELHERMASHVDDRMTAIAKLIRSDNRVLVERMVAMQEVAQSQTAALMDAQVRAAERAAEPAEVDPELLRSLLRAVKELQAGLASDMLGTMDQRFQAVGDQLHRETQSTTEAMVKVAEILGEKIDRIGTRVAADRGSTPRLEID